MKKGIFITGTGTDVGKTYVSALLVKKLHLSGVKAGYYKAAISGAKTLAESDAGYVKQISGIPQPLDTMVSYVYQTPVSPHLAVGLQSNGKPVELSRVMADFQAVQKEHQFVVVEGSGGIICPLRHDEQATIFLEDVLKAMELEALLVADAGLGTINATVLTVSYLRHKKIPIAGILINRYDEYDEFGQYEMHEDNCHMIENITGVPVLGRVPVDCDSLQLDAFAWKVIQGG